MFPTPQRWFALLAARAHCRHAEPAAEQHPQLPLCRDAPQTLLSPFIFVPSTAPPEMQNLSAGLVRFHPINGSPMLQSTQTPLQGILSLKRDNSTFQFGTISKISKVYSTSACRLLKNTLNRTVPRTEHCRTALQNITRQMWLCALQPSEPCPWTVLNPMQCEPTHPTQPCWEGQYENPP